MKKSIIFDKSKLTGYYDYSGKRLTEEQREYIRKTYVPNKTPTRYMLANYFKVSYSTITKILKKQKK